METTYSPEQEAFRDSLRRYLADNHDQGIARQRHDVPVPHTETQWEALVSLGITAVLVPESNGGLGMGMVDMGVVMEELGRRVNVAPLLSSAVMGTRAAIAFQQEDLLPKLAQGQAIVTLAFEEEENSFLNWKSPVMACNGGKLTGKKIHVMDGLAASELFVTAVDGVYRVKGDAANIRREYCPTVDGSRRIAILYFDGTPAVRVGELSALAPVLDAAIVALCADAIGAAEMALQLSLQYAKERIQFGVPVGSFQAVQHMLAEMFQQVEMAKAGLHYALWALDDADPAEAHRAAAMLKVYVCEYFPRLGANAIQIFGGAGFTWEYDIQLYYKRLLSAELLLGNSEVWLEAVARIAID